MGEGSLEPGSVLETELIGLADGLDMEYAGRRGIKDDDL